MAEGDFQRAQNWLNGALSAMEGFEVPLAAWRVHGTAVEIYVRKASNVAAERHRALSRGIISRARELLAPRRIAS
jgi:hypothetical protein